MDVKSMFRRRSKTPEGKRRSRLSFGRSSEDVGHRPSDSLSRNSATLAASDAPGATAGTSSEVPPVPAIPQEATRDSAVSASSQSPASNVAVHDTKSSEVSSTSRSPPVTDRSSATSPSNRASQGSNIIPGRFDHEKHRRSLQRHYDAQPVIVRDAVAHGTKEAPNSVDNGYAAPTNTPSHAPVRPQGHPAFNNEHQDRQHRRNLTEDSIGVAQSYEDAEEEFAEGARSPLLETDAIPGFITADTQPALQRIIDNREAIDNARNNPQSRGARGMPVPPKDPARRVPVPQRASSAQAPERAPQATSGQSPYAIEGSSEPINLEGIVDLTNTVDTTYHTRYANPILHETVKPTVHHVLHEAKERDVHHHHIQHKVLPIKDVQQLPARHFVPDGPNGELVEVSASDIPGRTGENTQWRIEQTTPHRGEPLFSNETHGHETFAHHSQTAEGVPSSEHVWKHPPRYSDGTPENTRDSSGNPGSSGAKEALAATMRGKQPPPPHQTAAEATVAAHRTAADPAYGQPPAAGTSGAKNLAFRQKSQAQREQEAVAATAAARAAAKHS